MSYPKTGCPAAGCADQERLLKPGCVTANGLALNLSLRLAKTDAVPASTTLQGRTEKQVGKNQHESTLKTKIVK